MDRKEVLELIERVRKGSQKRKFSQAFDLQIRFRDIDLKKQEQKVDFFVPLPHSRGREPKICAFVDAQLVGQAKKLFENVVLGEEFEGWKDNKKGLKKLAKDYDFFVAQANLMAKLATIFGKTLGTKGKMPNPKAGCVVPGTANLEPLVSKLKKTVHVQTKNELAVKAPVGNENMKDEDVAENILAIYNQLMSSLAPNNIKSVGLKLTMGPIFMLGKETVKEDEKKA